MPACQTRHPPSSPQCSQARGPAPSRPGLVYELKLDGYRTLAFKAGGGVRLISGNEKDLSRDYPEMVTAGAQLSALPEGVLDGGSWQWTPPADRPSKPSSTLLPLRKGRHILYYAFAP
ncbi:MAG: hypothetical protein U1G07_05675 [Verrucomicrobiota bacterium]